MDPSFHDSKNISSGIVNIWAELSEFDFFVYFYCVSNHPVGDRLGNGIGVVGLKRNGESICSGRHVFFPAQKVGFCLSHQGMFRWWLFSFVVHWV
jgi:hypothetical protein